MIIPTKQLQQVVSELPKLDGIFTPRFSLGKASENWLRLDRAGEPQLNAWLDSERERVPGADRKLAAAYMMGRMAWSLALPLAGLALAGAWMTRVTPPAAALAVRLIPWEEDGKAGVAPVADFLLDSEQSEFSDLARDEAILPFRIALETLFLPLVTALHTYSSLPISALWRLAGDSLSAGFLHAGKQAACVDHAMGIALPMLREKSSPLHSRQTGFVNICIPERPDISEWFRIRGGCCRYYTAEGGEYCTTCVLRDAESRDKRLTDYLRRTHAEFAT